MAEKNTSKLSPFEKQQAEAAKQILEYKLGAEASIVSMIYKNPDLLRETNLQLNDIHNNCWRVYFEIARDLIINEKKVTLSEVDIGLYLEKHPKLADKYYNEYGGYQTIENAGFYIKEENFDSYVRDLRKWNVVAKLVKHGFPCDKARLSKISEQGLLSGLKKDCVDFIPNYDETDEEPVTLPAIFPNLLCNPNTGIGVAMACNWLPHNLREVAQAINDYMNGDEVCLPGPDFPTGGVIINSKDIPAIMKTGHGSVKVRGKYKIDDEIEFTTGALVVRGSKAQVPTLIDERNVNGSNLIFGEDGYISTNGVANITFENIGFTGVEKGTGKAIVLKSFKNKILNCSFNSFDIAISTEDGTNWTGENQIVNCDFTAINKCIVLNNGSDGDINGCLAPSNCNYFITGGYDAGFKIENNHDYSTNGTEISGYNVNFVGAGY